MIHLIQVSGAGNGGGLGRVRLEQITLNKHPQATLTTNSVINSSVGKYRS